jgi:hypothetical protein
MEVFIMRVVLTGIVSSIVNQVPDWQVLAKQKTLQVEYLGVPFEFKGKDPGRAAVYPASEYVEVSPGVFLEALSSLLFQNPAQARGNLVSRVWANPLPEAYGILLEGEVSDREVEKLLFGVASDRAWVLLPGSSLLAWSALHAEFGIELGMKKTAGEGEEAARLNLRLRASSRNQLIEAVCWAAKVFS